MGVKEVLQKKIGVITGEDVFSVRLVAAPFFNHKNPHYWAWLINRFLQLYNYARQHKFAIPSIVKLPAVMMLLVTDPK